MTYKPGHLRERSRDITNARNWGIGIVTTSLGLGLFVSEVQRIKAIQPDLLNYAYLALFILTGILIFLWIWATQRELNLLFEWLDPERFVPPSSLKETLMILFFAVLLTALLFAARSPLSYGIILTAYSVILIPSTIYLNTEIQEAINKSKNRLSEDLENQKLAVQAKLYAAGVEVLETYFIRRPMKLRLIIIMVASAIGLTLAIYWKKSQSRWVGVASYAVFFAIILFSEIVIARWRCIRDRELREIEANLSESLREDQGQK